MLRRSPRVRLMVTAAFWLQLGWCLTTLPAQDTHYYRKGEKIALTMKPEKNYVILQPQVKKPEIEELLKPKGAQVRKFGELKAQKNLNLDEAPDPIRPNWAIIESINLEANPLVQDAEVAERVLYRTPFFKTSEGVEVGLSHLVFVKLKQASDKEKLERLAREFKVQIVGNNKFMPLWYTLACSKESVGNALEVANKLYETEQFAASEPDFMSDFQIKAPGDQHYGEQWGLDNTGQHGGTAGIDIKASAAWAKTTGHSSIVVAVLDHGVELNHPDLPNISASSYDTGTGASPSVVRGSHGTACAGIIGAARNNAGLGVAGIAPDTTLMSISNSLMLGPNVQQELADGINWAWQNGASVISNSWGHNALASQLIDDAIEEALTNGRSGKGTVVVFAAGNEDSAVGYPAKSNPGILAVGAMSPCGERKGPSSCDPESFWGSNYGDQLDIAAPGVLIPTTDLQGTAGYVVGDYTLRFNGTSSACPHVAGVAALILSVNPSLTRLQVADLIESTAQKVGSYSYATTPSRPNGTWHKEMGHGLVNASACVDAAIASLPAAHTSLAKSPKADLTLEEPSNGSQSAQRDISQFKPASVKLATDISKLSSSRPKNVVVGAHSSTFDLWNDGVMHLGLGGNSMWCYPIDYLGSFGQVAVYKERSSFGWIWYFYPDGQIFFFTDTAGPFTFDSAAKWYDRQP